MLQTSIKFSVAAFGAAGLALTAMPQDTTAQSFAGKTIEVIVPAGAGGGLTRADLQRTSGNTFPAIRP